MNNDGSVTLWGSTAAFALGFVTERNTVILPQSPLSVKEATETLKKYVGNLLEGKDGEKCRKFLDAALKKLGQLTGVPTLRRTFQSTFNRLAQSPGFEDESGWTTKRGRAIPDSNGNLYALGVNFALATPNGPYSVPYVAIHESFHGAAKTGLYSQYHIAKAAFDVGRQMGIVPDLVPPPINSTEEKADTYNSQLFNQTVFNACGKK